MMFKPTVLFSLALATVSAGTLSAQAADSAATTDTYAQQAQPAPIQRSAPMQPAKNGNGVAYTTSLAVGQVLAPTSATASVQPIAGVYLRVAANSAVRAVAIGPQRTELKVERGLVNLSVHDPAKDMVIVIDLPGGQVQPYKNGFYTFNAATDTARTLVGEADVFALNAAPDAKPVKLKEQHVVTFPAAGTQARLSTHDFYPYEARTDVIAAPYGDRHGDGPAYGAYYGYPYYAYDGFYGYGYPYYPYYAFGGPFWGYPYGVGLGFGYYGGFYGGGFRGFRR